MSKYYVGIDLGGTDIKVGILNEDFDIIEKRVIPTFSNRSVENIVADIVAAGKAVVKMAGLSESDILHVGVGLPATINNKTNIITFAVNLRWRNVDFIKLFKELWDIPVFIGNDADAAAIAEVCVGVAKGYDHAIVLTLGTGVGGGLIFDRKIFKGNGYGTEPGHIIIVVDGEQCICGARGCLEAYASVTALTRDAKRMMEKHPESLMHRLCGGTDSQITGKMIFDAAKRDDPAAKIVVENFVKYLGAGIASFCNALRPQVVILGGGLSNAGAPLFEPLDQIVESLIVTTEEGKFPPILKAKLGNDAGIIGAALFGVSI